MSCRIANAMKAGRCCVVAALVAVTGTPALAELTIEFVPLSDSTNPYLEGSSIVEAPHDDDPGSARLEKVLEYVGSVYSDAFEVDHTIEITYLWQEGLSFAAQAPPNLVYEENGQITHAVVRFDPNFGSTDWFIDDTPGKSEEFQPLGQVLYQDLAEPIQTDRFWANTPSVFEAGYNGDALSGSDAAGALDLVTVAFQEVGHAIGLSSGFSQLTNDNGDGEAGDGIFNVPTDWVNGDVMGIRTLGIGDNGPQAHLAGDDAVMSYLQNGERTLPSAADFMAIATTNGWMDLDLPRKDFIADGGDWRLGSHWLGGRSPDADDDAYIRNGAQVTTSANRALGSPVAKNLTIRNGSSLSTGDDSVWIGNDVLVEAGASGVGAALHVQQDGQLSADDVAIGDGGVLSVTRGVVDADVLSVADGGQLQVTGVANSPLVDANFLKTNSGGQLIGHGDVHADDITNNGTIISAAFAGGPMLRLFADNSGHIDLDGSDSFGPGGSLDGTGHVYAVLGDLAVIGAVSDAFDGEMTIGANHSIAFAGPWQIGDNLALTSPLIRMQGGADEAAAATLTGLPGADITANAGEIVVTGYAAIDSDIEFRPNIAVQVGPGDVLMLNGHTTLGGGAYTGAGTIRFNGETVVDSSTTIDVAYADLDGHGPGTILNAVTINGARLTLNVNAIDSPGSSNRFDAVMNLNNMWGGLDVNLNDPDAFWQMAGTLNMNGGPLPAVGSSMLTGSEVRVIGQINVDGVATVAANLDIAGDVVTADASSRLYLGSGSHIIRDSATVTGPGSLSVSGPASLQLEDGAQVAVDVFVRSRLEPGVGIGQATVVGDVDMNPFAEYAVELAGTADDDYDSLRVTGDADLDGTIEVSLVDLFLPKKGAQFTVLRADAVTGMFAEVETLTNDFYNFNVDVQYLPKSVVVEFQGLFIPGDYNEDGRVDAADYTVLRDAANKKGAQLANDLVGGPVGDDHYEQWRTHYGFSLDQIPAAKFFSAPEPAGLLLAALGLALAPAARRRS